MTGRSKFEKYHIFIRSLEYLFFHLPGCVKRFLWNISNSSCGVISLMIRYLVMRTSAKSCGSNIYIGPNVTFNNIENLTVGDNVSIHVGCYIDALGGVEIGDNVSIAHYSSVMSFNHTWFDLERPIKYNPVRPDRVVISSDVWIGCGVRIMPGVTIGSRSVVGAGAVVVKDVANNTLAGGVPARSLKTLND